MNNSIFGLNLQRIICERYKISPNCLSLKKLFDTNLDLSFDKEYGYIVDSVFSILKLNPIECTTMDSIDGKNVPYNFILNDNSTLSIRTNMKGDKVAPREVGQAGYEKLNQYFGHIYGKKIESQNDIKSLIINHIDEVLPIFFNFLIDANYIVWLYFNGDSYSYELIKGDCFADMSFIKEKFSFTKSLIDWNESTTIKYDGVSIAEVQVHRNRTFKFRFIMKNILQYIKSKSLNSESLGITAEKTVCDLFGLKYPDSFMMRYIPSLETKLMPVMKEAFKFLPPAIKHTGSSYGERGGASKCSYDFVLYGEKTLSLKTNWGDKVCPPEVGQPSASTCYLYFKDFVDESYIDRENFKKMVFNHIEKLIPIYVKHLFDSDYLLRLYNKKDKFYYQIIEKDYGISVSWSKSDFDFSKKSVVEWNESNTLYYKGVSIGEFQVHNHRNCFKFRFNFNNLLKFISK